MKAILSLKLVLIVFCLTVIASNISAQDMKKPDPVKNETTDMLLGIWEAEPYEMMGEMRTETANHYMKNGQYMFIDISGGSKSFPSAYNSTVIMKINPDGTLIGWAGDDWGFIHNYTGTYKGNKISVKGTGSGGDNDLREIEINGNKMVHKVTFNMKDAEGKPMVINQTITYNKK